jgi:hypothetical protein
MNKYISVGDVNDNKYKTFMLGFDSRGRTDALSTNNSWWPE